MRGEEGGRAQLNFVILIVVFIMDTTPYLLIIIIFLDDRNNEIFNILVIWYQDFKHLYDLPFPHAPPPAAGSNDLERYNLKAVVDLANNMATLEPHKLFTKLFRLTLQYRLDEDLFSRGLFSPAQMYVLDEFCARYGVRDPFRHLTYLQDWLDYTEGGVSIWPVHDAVFI